MMSLPIRQNFDEHLSPAEEAQIKAMKQYIAKNKPVTGLSTSNDLQTVVNDVIRMSDLPPDKKSGGLDELVQLAEQVVLSSALLSLNFSYSDNADGSVNIVIPPEVQAVSTRIQHFYMGFNVDFSTGNVIDITAAVRATKAMHSLREQMKLKTLVIGFIVDADCMSDEDARCNVWIHASTLDASPSTEAQPGTPLSTAIIGLLRAAAVVFNDSEVKKVFKLSVRRNKPTYEERCFQAQKENLGLRYEPAGWQPWKRNCEMEFSWSDNINDVFGKALASSVEAVIA